MGHRRHRLESEGLKRAQRLGVPSRPKEWRARGDAGIRRRAHGFRRHLRGRPRRHKAFCGPRQDADRPDAGGDRSVRRPGGQPRQHISARNVNMVTCGGQATIPIVAAVARCAPCTTPRSSRPSRRDPPGPARAPISTSSPRPRRADRTSRRRAARQGDHRAQPGRSAADHARTVSAVVGCRAARDRASVDAMVAEVQTYVPGYRLKQRVQFDASAPRRSPFPATASSTGSRPACSSRSKARRTTCPPMPAIWTS